MVRLAAPYNYRVTLHSLGCYYPTSSSRLRMHAGLLGDRYPTSPVLNIHQRHQRGKRALTRVPRPGSLSICSSPPWACAITRQR